MTVKQYISIKGQLRAVFSAALGFTPSDVTLFRLALFAGRSVKENAA